ncbi:MAG: hypothetical protein V1835_02200 [Candidatus Micrarchaeota archaeon]
MVKLTREEFKEKYRVSPVFVHDLDARFGSEVLRLLCHEAAATLLNGRDHSHFFKNKQDAPFIQILLAARKRNAEDVRKHSHDLIGVLSAQHKNSGMRVWIPVIKEIGQTPQNLIDAYHALFAELEKMPKSHPNQ